jgi:hypothetical protein
MRQPKDAANEDAREKPRWLAASRRMLSAAAMCDAGGTRLAAGLLGDVHAGGGRGRRRR